MILRKRQRKRMIAQRLDRGQRAKAGSLPMRVCRERYTRVSDRETDSRHHSLAGVNCGQSNA
jgi:hypothetical protein